MHDSLQKALRYFFLLAFFFIIGISWIWDKEFQGYSLQKIWNTTDHLLFFASVIFISLAMPFVALRWRALFPPESKEDTSPMYLTGILCAAFVFNLALPGPVGEALCAWLASTKSSVSFSEALAALGFSRIIGLASACLIAGVVYWIAPFAIPEEWSFALSLSASLLFFGALALLFLASYPAVPHSIFTKLKSNRFLSASFLQKTIDGILSFLDALLQTTKRGKKAYVESLLWSLLGHGMVGLGIYWATQSMGMTAPWSAVLFTYSASIAGSVVMFVFPGSALGWDALFASTLALTAKLPTPIAIAVTAVIRLQQILVALWGIIVIWSETKTILPYLSQRKHIEKDNNSNNTK